VIKIVDKAKLKMQALGQSYQIKKGQVTTLIEDINKVPNLGNIKSEICRILPISTRGAARLKFWKNLKFRK